MLIKTLTLITMLFFAHLYSYAQSGKIPEAVQDSLAEPGLPGIHLSTRSLQIGDSAFLLLNNCKNFGVVVISHSGTQKTAPPQNASEEKVPAVAVHGNILYNFNYRSYIDTPFAQTGLIQHFVQTNLNFLVKGQYPVKMTISNRYNNSPFFRNSTDVNIQFNQNQLLGIIKGNLKKKAEDLVNKNDYNLATLAYNTERQKIKELQSWINNPSRIKEIDEEREMGTGLQAGRSLSNTNQPGNGEAADELVKPMNRGKKLFGKNNQQNYLDSLKNAAAKKLPALTDSAVTGRIESIKDSILKKKEALFASGLDSSLTGKAKSVKDSMLKKKDNLFATARNKAAKMEDSSSVKKYEAAKQKLDSLKKQLTVYEARVKKTRKQVSDSIALLKSQVNSLTGSAGLMAFMKKHQIDSPGLSKAQKLLLSVSQFGIGRTWIDYSELTVKNISLAGVNIEMNPGKFYIAAATGKINYRFRDFVLKNNTSLPDQSLSLIRFGLGQKEGNNIIATFYNGKKSVLGNVADSGMEASQRVLGFSLEGRFSLNENNYVIAEVAKSSFGNPVNGQKPSFTELIGKATNMSIKTNYAYSIKLFSQYPQTNTSVTGFYRSFGKDFQSFNLMPSNVKTAAWMIKLNQYLWNKKLAIDASVKKNDFTSALANPGFSSQAIFKSFQLSVRIPKYPFVSIGFFPTSQLSLSSTNVLTENQFNTLNAVMSHSYQIKKIEMNTNAVFTKFYNTSPDTGFIYFNASSWSVNHSLFLSPLTLQTGVSVISQSKLYLFTLEQMASYQFKSIVTVGASVKWNRLNHIKTLVGGMVSLGLSIRKIGSLQFNYDKTFLPGYNRELIPVDMGRMTFYREF